MSIKGEASEIHQNPEAPARRNWILRCGGCRTPIYPSICLGRVRICLCLFLFARARGRGLAPTVYLSLPCLLACLLAWGVSPYWSSGPKAYPLGARLSGR